MHPNCKPIHARAYTVPRSVEQQLQQSKEILRLVGIGVLEEDYFSECASPSFAIPEKNGSSTTRVVTDFRKLNLLLKRSTPLISYSKDWGHDPFNGRFYLCFGIGLKYGILSHQTWCWCSKAMYHCIPMVHGKYKYKRLPMGIKIAMVPDVFQNVMSKLDQDMEYVKIYLDGLLILTNSSFKDHLLKLEMVLARLSINELLVWEWTFPNLSSLQNK
jgi:hypothetical protein